MFAAPLVRDYTAHGTLVGLCDVNPKRMAYYNARLGCDVPTFADFDAMLRTVRPDVVIVTSKDATHDRFIVGALRAGCDVITEKPMTTDDAKCRAILRAERETGRRVTVTFNYRFGPYVARVRELLAAGTIGELLSVDFHWILDRSHGADYFRRWHRRRENSGGLLVHKATHHFDMVNWYLDARPEVVHAFGSRRFYGPTRDRRGERCLTCDHKRTCEFYYDIEADAEVKALYRDCEDADGYFRDRCVFADEIDIEDSMAVSVRYDNGVLMSYSLIAHALYEGWQMTLNGRAGRIEAAEYHSGPAADDADQIIRVYRPERPVTCEEVRVPKDTGAHGGGDERLQRMLFVGDQPDPLKQMAGSLAGAMSILTGIAANRSIATQAPVRIDGLLRDADGDALSS